MGVFGVFMFFIFIMVSILTCLVEVFQADNEYPLLPSLSQAIHLNIYFSFPLSLQHHRQLLLLSSPLHYHLPVISFQFSFFHDPYSLFDY